MAAPFGWPTRCREAQEETEEAEEAEEAEEVRVEDGAAVAVSCCIRCCWGVLFTVLGFRR